MPKVTWKPGTMLYPVPAVMITSKYGDIENVFTVSWVGTICTNPPMLSVSIRPERYSYELIKNSREFAVNIPDKHLAGAADYCGVKSGRDVNKFAELGLIKEKASKIMAPLIRQCPVSIECVVKDILELGSHHMFIAEVVAVNVEESLIGNTGKLNLTKAGLICYNHGQYCIAEKPLGKFGFSIQKKKTND
jgi:flavin reductase (DIM6/NTAB) family NADH-FMN oxidoreductase RutF